MTKFQRKNYTPALKKQASGEVTQESDGHNCVGQDADKHA